MSLPTPTLTLNATVYYFDKENFVIKSSTISRIVAEENSEGSIVTYQLADGTSFVESDNKLFSTDSDVANNVKTQLLNK